MADAAKSNEIEDVLSSIRRLVSEHQPPDRARTPEPSDPAEVDEPAPEATDALILTPALRVTDPEDPWLPITPRDDEAGEVSDVPETVAEPGKEDGADWARGLWAEDEGEPAESLDPQLQADQWEATGTTPDEDAPEAIIEDLALDTPLDVTEAVLEQATLPEEAETDAGDDEEDLPDVPLSFIRSGSASLTDYEPEEGDRDLAQEDLPAAMRDLAQSRAAQRALEDETPAEPTRVKVAIVRAPSEDDRPAESEQDPDLPETAQDADLPGLDDEPPTDFLAPDEMSETVEDLGEAPFSFPDEDDSFVDEAALRELIVEVVREELQGEMGVRITRNIRKLVRREIRLALAAQELD